MTRKEIRRLVVAGAFAFAMILAGTAGGFAGEQDEKPGMGDSGMAMPMMDEGMMAMHQEMHAKMEAMDSKLADLVVEMNAASGEQKTDAIAAVVTELVAQRKAMHGMMMKMQTKMMQGKRKSMGDCPMMKQMPSADEQAEEEEHSEHHPEG